MFSRETNSAKPGNEPLEKIMNKMSTYKIIAKITNAGKFVQFVNLGKFTDSIMFVLDSVPASKRDDARKQADALLKESAIKSIIEPMFSYLPEKAVNIGDTWETSYFNVSGTMSILSLNTHKLEGIENNLARVSGTSEAEAMPSTDPAEANAFPTHRSPRFPASHRECWCPDRLFRLDAAAASIGSNGIAHLVRWR